MSERAGAWRAAYDRYERQGPARFGEQRIRVPGRMRTVPDADEPYWVDWSDLIGAGLQGRIDEILAEERAHARALGRTVEWKLYDHDLPADLRGRLAAAGYEIGQPEALVIGSVEELRSSLGRWWEARNRNAGTGASEASVRRPGPDDMRVVSDVLEAVYDDRFESSTDRLARQTAAAPEQVDVVVVEEWGEPVAVGWSWYQPDSPFATLWGGATVPRARGRGHYHALLAARLDEAAARGRRLASVDAGPMSRPILEAIGFETVGWTTPCVVQPS